MSINSVSSRTLGEEMAEDARVWTEYAQEADEFDTHILDAWNRTTDVMLVFAALFSGVLTAFLAGSLQQLSPNPQDFTNSVLLSISNSLRSQPTVNSSASASTSSIMSESSFVPSTSALWINGLWLASLTCSLGVSSVAMLVKQWLNAYVSGLSATHHLRAQARQYRYDAFLTWRTSHIINSLPLVMSFCLMLFLGGLAIMLLSLSRPVAFASIAIMAVTFIFHLSSLILPAICECPWKTALSPVMFRLFAPLRRPWATLETPPWMRQMRHIPVIVLTGCAYGLSFVPVCLCMIFWIIPKRLACISKQILPEIRENLDLCQDIILSTLVWILLTAGNVFVAVFHFLLYLPFQHICTAVMNFWRSASEADHEESIIRKQATVLAARAIVWLMHTSTRPAVVDHGVQAISGLPHDTGAALVLYQCRATQILRDRLQSCFRGKQLNSPEEAEMYARGLLRLHVTLRILNQGREMESCRDDTILAKALSIPSTTESMPAIIACLCVGGRLHDMVTALEQHFSGVNRLDPFQVHLLVDTLGQEIAWRKRPEDNRWTNLPSGNWGGLLPRVLPLLINHLDPQSSSSTDTSDPLLVDTAISFTLAMFTRGHPAVNIHTYMTESHRKMHFHYLIIIGLAPILRFPESFGCSKDLLDVAQAKYELAIGLFAKYRCSFHLLGHAELRDLLRWSSVNSSQFGDLIFSLTLMDTEVIATLDCSGLLQALPSVNPEGMHRIHLLELFERMCEECSKDAVFARSGVTRILAGVMRTSTVHIKLQAFRLLIRIARQLIRAGSSSSFQVMVDENLLGVLGKFVDDNLWLRQDDFDRLMIMLSGLCKTHTSAVVRSGLIQALDNWASRYWRNTELMWKHKDAFLTMASRLDIKVNVWDDTSWFKPSVLSRTEMLSRGG